MFDDSIYSLNTHDSKWDTSEDCHAIYAEGNNEEPIYEIPVPKNRDLKNRNLVPMSVSVLDTMGIIDSKELLEVLFYPSLARTIINSSAVTSKAVSVEMKWGKGSIQS